MTTNETTNTDYRPFWAVEQGYLKQRRALEDSCNSAHTLLTAIRTGVNTIYLDGKWIGYLDEDGTIQLQDSYLTPDQTANWAAGKTPVRFSHLDEDGDGYTVAYFETDTGEGE